MRQGNLFFKRIDQLPKKVKLVKSDIIQMGKSTGHAHRLTNGQIYKDGELLYLVALKNAVITHDEHRSIKLPKGNYAIIRQRQYEGKDMTSIVRD